MYSYTVTGINNIHPIDPTQPKLRIRCKCQRDLIQEEIYTCISCATYCCHYCTIIPEIMYFQCRTCRAITDSSKHNKCKMCFSCPYCSNVLVMSRTKDKKFMMLCQYCYWTTKEMNLVCERGEQLIETLNEIASNMGENEYKIYSAAQGLFKEVSAIVEHENQVSKYSKATRKVFKKNQEESLLDTKTQIEKTCQSLVKRSGLDDVAPDFDGDVKVPQNLPLLAKKTRRCPNCKKPLTTTFKTRSGQQKTELLYKDLKVLQCQRKPAIDGKVKVKCLRDLVLNEDQTCQAQQVKEVSTNETFKVRIEIVNKTKQITNQIEYDFIVLAE